MNRKLLLPRRTGRTNWFRRLIARIDTTRRTFALYRFYRGLGHPLRDAWSKAERTIL